MLVLLLLLLRLSRLLVEGLAKGDGAVFRRVVVVYVEVALARQLEVEVPVLGHSVQHVVQEPEPSVHLRHSSIGLDWGGLDWISI